MFGTDGVSIFITNFSCLVFRNLNVLSMHSGEVDTKLLPSFNYSDHSSVDLEAYRGWYKLHGNNIPGNLTDCDLEKEMQKVSPTQLILVCYGGIFSISELHMEAKA